MLVLTTGGGPVSSNEIDSFVKAIIPGANEAEGRLRQLALQHMVHGPCGITTLTAPCMDPTFKKCTQFFPKPITTVTHIDDKGYAHNKRPEFAPLMQQSGREINNWWVVPYNPAVLL